MSAIQNISLYVPHVFANYSKAAVAKIFSEYVGHVKEVDFVSKKSHDGRPYNAAYIHFHAWHNNHATVNLQARVLDPTQEARIVYDDPWYWIVLENKGQKSARANTPPMACRDEFPAIVTPRKAAATGAAVPPNAPTKAARNQTMLTEKMPITNLEDVFDEVLAKEARDAIMLYELQDLMDDDDRFLITIDGRYVRAIESENAHMRAKLDHLNHIYQAEFSKTAALTAAMTGTITAK
jgi:hypothetical protein